MSPTGTKGTLRSAVAGGEGGNYVTYRKIPKSFQPEQPHHRLVPFSSRARQQRLAVLVNSS